MYKPDENNTPGTFFFFFLPSVRSDPQTPVSLGSGDALVNVQWENCQIEGFLSATVQNHQPCLKIVILDRTCTLSMLLLAAGGRAYALVPKSWFGGFLLCLWHNSFYVMVSCFKFFSSFWLWGLPRKPNVSNCRKIWKPADCLRISESVINSLRYRLMRYSVHSDVLIHSGRRSFALVFFNIK